MYILGVWPIEPATGLFKRYNLSHTNDIMLNQITCNKFKLFTVLQILYK